jgi:hypothetical protein
MTNLISPIPAQQLTRRALIGARIDDPVLRERPGRSRRRLRREREERVHFHLGDDARPFVCEARDCRSPGLTLTPASGGA